ncbi:Chloride channel protein 1 [Trichinella patagoniensis]|uniref:Chloride channel protein 1 n=2 Tax=Trichinella TaxID=6333 RepID=A0A0V0ZM20_9BILA|nr:Chloride channel protein 1 [Trichinella patagoniensis]
MNYIICLPLALQLINKKPVLLAVALDTLAERKMDAELFLINTDDFQSNEAKTSKRNSRHYGLWNAVMEKLQEVWIQLILLGIFMGTLSFTIDLCAEKLRMLHMWLYLRAAALHPIAQPVVWVIYTLLFISISTAACHYISPEAAGSGIPVIKTILGGLNLKEYLSCRVLICKTVVLILILGSGLPLGKEDPFVHIAVMLATLLNKASRAGSHLKNTEVQNRISNEILAAASAVGIACTLGTPIGGVLFSIEITSVCFPLQGYWRGFIASVTSTVTFRFLAYLLHESSRHMTITVFSTLVELSRTYFPKDYPFDPKELFAFALLGIFCGFLAILFIQPHRMIMKKVTGSKRIRKLLNDRPVCYSAIIVIIIMSLMCPMGYGHYFAGGLIPSETVPELLSNVSWNLKNYTTIDSRLIEHWSIDRISVFLVLPLYALNLLWIMAVILTLPIPCGVYMPVFVIGAAFGRLLGEAMTVAFPEGLRNDGEVSPIIPGAYAVVGAAAFVGAVTHAISVSVVTLELTGEVQYMLPMLLTVLIAVSICESVQSSLYVSIIELSGLPCFKVKKRIPRHIRNLEVGQIMVKNVRYVTLEATYREVQDLLIELPKILCFPLVKDSTTMILLGSVQRSQLDKMLNAKVGVIPRKQEALRRLQELKNRAEEKPEKRSRFTVSRVKSNELQQESSAKVTQDLMINVENNNNNNTSDQHSEQWEWKNLENMNTIAAARSLMTTRSLFNCLSGKSNTLAEKFVQQTVIDLVGKERRQWEAEQLDSKVQINMDILDPAPFQLVENTNVMQASMLFNQLGITSAYVTSLGSLVGVVSLREIRQALELVRNSFTSQTRNDAEDEYSRKSDSTKVRWSLRNILNL